MSETPIPLCRSLAHTLRGFGCLLVVAAAVLGRPASAQEISSIAFGVCNPTGDGSLATEIRVAPSAGLSCDTPAAVPFYRIVIEHPWWRIADELRLAPSLSFGGATWCSQTGCETIDPDIAILTDDFQGQPRGRFEVRYNDGAASVPFRAEWCIPAQPPNCRASIP